MQNATNFFLFFCMSLGDVEKQWQVRLQESNTTTPPHPTPPNVDLLCMKPIYRHGIMDRPWLQRKRTDTLTTQRNLFFSSWFCCCFFFFYKPPLPKTKKKNKQNILLPRVRGWSHREDWEKVLAETFNHLHHRPERNKEDTFQRLLPGDHLRSLETWYYQQLLVQTVP